MRYAIMAASLLLAGCGDLLGPANRGPANRQGESRPEPPVVEARAGGADGCAFTWDGSPASPEQVLERAVQALMRDIERQGGIEAVTELTPADVRVDEALPYRCFAGLLHQVQRAGFGNVRLSSLASGGGGRLSNAGFNLALPALDGTEPPVEPQQNVMAVDPAGQMTWNGAAVDRVTLRQYLDLTTTMRPQPRLVFQPAAETPYEQIAILLAVARDAGVETVELPGTVLGSNEPFTMNVGLNGITPPDLLPVPGEGAGLESPPPPPAPGA